MTKREILRLLRRVDDADAEIGFRHQDCGADFPVDPIAGIYKLPVDDFGFYEQQYDECSYRNAKGEVEIATMSVYEYKGYFFGIRENMSFESLATELTTGASHKDLKYMSIKTVLNSIVSIVDNRRRFDKALAELRKQYGRLNTRLIKRLKGTR